MLLNKLVSIRFGWISGHCGIYGNTLTDHLTCLTALFSIFIARTPSLDFFFLSHVKFVHKFLVVQSIFSKAIINLFNPTYFLYQTSVISKRSSCEILLLPFMDWWSAVIVFAYLYKLTCSVDNYLVVDFDHAIVKFSYYKMFSIKIFS